MKRTFCLRLLTLTLLCVSIKGYARSDDGFFDSERVRETDFFAEKKKRVRERETDRQNPAGFIFEEEKEEVGENESFSGLFPFESDDDSKLYAPPPESGDGQKLTDEDGTPVLPLDNGKDWLFLLLLISGTELSLFMRRKTKEQSNVVDIM